MSTIRSHYEAIAYGLFQTGILRFRDCPGIGEAGVGIESNLDRLDEYPELKGMLAFAIGDTIRRAGFLPDPEGVSSYLFVASPAIKRVLSHIVPDTDGGPTECHKDGTVVGGVMLRAADVLQFEQQHAELPPVVGVVTLFDQQLGDRTILTEPSGGDMRVATVFTGSGLAGYALEHGMGDITADMYERLVESLHLAEFALQY